MCLNDGAVSKAILNAAGPGIQVDCTRLGPISDGGIVVTSGHNLQCKEVCHAHCPDWNSGKAETVSNLSIVLQENIRHSSNIDQYIFKFTYLVLRILLKYIFRNEFQIIIKHGFC